MARASLPPSLKDLSWLEELTFEQLAKLADAIQGQLNAKRHEVREQLRQEHSMTRPGYLASIRSTSSLATRRGSIAAR